MIQIERKAPPLGAAVFYRRLIEPFEPGLRHVFELAVYSNEDPVPGEIQLVKRLQTRFGKKGVGVIKTDAAALVLRILSEPLTRDCGKWHIANTIAKTTLQHYGWSFPVDIRAAECSICGTRAPAYLRA